MLAHAVRQPAAPKSRPFGPGRRAGPGGGENDYNGECAQDCCLDRVHHESFQVLITSVTGMWSESGSRVTENTAGRRRPPRPPEADGRRAAQAAAEP